MITGGRGNQANSAYPCKSAQYNFYRKRQKGAVSFIYMYNMKDFTMNSLLPLSVEMVLSGLTRMSVICLVSSNFFIDFHEVMNELYCNLSLSVCMCVGDRL